MIGLVVKHAFGDYEVGDLIADPDYVAKVLASEHEARVVKVNVPDPVDAAPATKPLRKTKAP
ncbi:hypothetical protein [Paraburkholderia kururiensis]|uniref:hypothetical protein n=1 Tax=Paraburkholderia kururiensis TaxID=984307 RepID=UPI0005A62E09|nr:hypothetical protein [Paraburkholderia kururiensis]